MPGKKTWWQKQQQQERTEEKAHHHAEKHIHPDAPAAVFESVPSWLTELVDILEAIWASLSASESEPNHVVTQKLKAFKAKLPKHE